jgi:putative FmdB family regulatory protein
MPIYDFKCGECDKEFEKLVRLADIPPECPLCGSKDTKKKEIQAINFELKGVGVYKNNTQ